MNDAMRELGRRAIAAGWRWVPGCANQYGERVTRVVRHMNGADIEAWDPRAFGWTSSESFIGVEDIPDFSDPATLGCLLAQVRERWGKPMACVSAHHGDYDIEWFVADPTSFDDLSVARACPTEAAALVAALEAAPKVAP